MKRFYVFLVVAVVSLSVFAEEVTEVKIGAGWEMTGPIAGFGQMSWDGGSKAGDEA